MAFKNFDDILSTVRGSTHVPTRVPEIDAALGGGFPPGIVFIEEDDLGDAARVLRHAGHLCLSANSSADADDFLHQVQKGISEPGLVVLEDIDWQPDSVFLEPIRQRLAEYTDRTLVFVGNRVTAEWVRNANLVLQVSARGPWSVLKSRDALTPIAPFTVEVPLPIPPNVLIPTGLPALDLALGGGFPQGLIYIRGNRKNIQRVMEAIQNVPQGHYRVSAVSFAVENVHAAILSHIQTQPMLMLDLGDLSGDLREKAGCMNHLERLRDRVVAYLPPVCVIFEAHAESQVRQELNALTDVVLTATDEGPWFVAKAYGGPLIDWRDAVQFDPLWTPPPEPKPRQPVTPERIIDTLAKDPVLLLAVAKKLRVLYPWVAVGETWWERKDVIHDFETVTCRIEGEKGWLWSFFVPMSSGGEEVNNKGYYKTAEEAKAACDEWLRSQGWYLT